MVGFFLLVLSIWKTGNKPFFVQQTEFMLYKLHQGGFVFSLVSFSSAVGLSAGLHKTTEQIFT